MFRIWFLGHQDDPARTCQPASKTRPGIECARLDELIPYRGRQGPWLFQSPNVGKARARNEFTGFFFRIMKLDRSVQVVQEVAGYSASE